jgi:hypothetical protein
MNDLVLHVEPDFEGAGILIRPLDPRLFETVKHAIYTAFPGRNAPSAAQAIEFHVFKARMDPILSRLLNGAVDLRSTLASVRLGSFRTEAK